MTNPQGVSNETPQAPVPGTASPTPQQQTQGDKPATKPNEQQK
jgi:hypothetical protein